MNARVGFFPEGVRKTISKAGHCAVALAAVAVAALALGGCQAIFTWSPVTALARSPASMSPEQQVAYGRDALASGDTAAMQAAYDQLKGQTGSADAQYLAGQLGVELSGFPQLFLDAINGAVTLDPGAAIDIPQFIADNGLTPELLIDAAAELQAAQALGADLGPMDYVMGAMGLALQAAQATTPAYDINAVDLAPAITFLAPVVDEVATLPADDPLRQFIDSYDSYLQGI